MDSLPYELLTEIFKLITIMNTNKCHQSTQLMKHILQLCMRQAFVIKSKDRKISRHTLAIVGEHNLLPTNVMCINTRDTHIYSQKLTHVFFNMSSYGSIIFNNVIWNSCPNLTHVGGKQLLFHETKLSPSLVFLEFYDFCSTTFNDDISHLSRLKYLKLGALRNNLQEHISLKKLYSLTHVTLNKYFSHRHIITKWPKKLIYLKIKDFDQWVRNARNHGLQLPPSLQYLIIRYFSVHSFDESFLPINLKYLVVDMNGESKVLDHGSSVIDVPNAKISNITNITFGKNMISLCLTKQLLYCPKLPQSLKKLYVNDFKNDICRKLLDTIKNLKLTHLVIHSMRMKLINNIVTWFNKTDLPLLTHLSTVSGIIGVTKLPVNLTHLKLKNSSALGRIECLAKSKITHLGLTCLNPKDQFPESLIHLKLYTTYNYSNQYPVGLKSLSIKYYYQSIIPDLPCHLTHLTLIEGTHKKNIITTDEKITNKTKLPKSLKYLKVPSVYFIDVPKSINLVIYL